MSTQNTTIIAKIFEKYKDKIWFQIIVAIFVIQFFFGNIITTTVYNKILKKNTQETVIESIENHENHLKEEHKINFEKSKQCYSIAKTIMKHYQEEINSDYMFLIEYHNGSENVINGIQFCRFDITLEVNSQEVPIVSLDKFKDDLVARYDLLISDDLTYSKGVLEYTAQEIEYIDRYLSQYLKNIDAKYFSIINILDEDKNICGSLVCISLNEKMNSSKIYQCEIELEMLFKNTYKN